MKARHHMALAIALWGLAAGVALGVTPERSSGFRASLTSFNYSNALPIRTAFNQLRGDPPSGGNLLTSHSRIEVSYGLGAWQFGTYWRSDYDARFDRDTAQLLYARQNHARIATGRDYTLDIEANQVAGFGASVARTYTFDDARLGVRVAALRADRLIEGSAKGRLTVAADGSISGAARLNYSYTDDIVLHRPHQGHPVGYGLGLDLSGTYAINPAWRIDARIDDLLTWVRWNDAPYTRASLRLARPHLAADGTLDTQALLTGVERSRSRWQRLPVRFDVSTSYRLTPVLEAYARVRGIDALLLPAVGVRWRFGADSEWSLGWNARANAVELGFSTARRSVSLSSDQADLGRARLLALQLRSGGDE